MLTGSAETTQKVGEAAVEVGKVFGNGGTDGLILYALILATFLMFLACVAFALLLRRALSSLDSLSKQSAEASTRVADALKDLATSISSKNATDSAHQLLIASTLSRVEALLPGKDKRG